MPTESQFTSGAERNISLGFPFADILAAKAVVRRLVKMGERKPPNELLIISDSYYEQWLMDEAVKWLQEQKALRQAS